VKVILLKNWNKS